MGGLRGRGWTWLLSMLWGVIGAGGAGYAFVMTTHAYWGDTFTFPQWHGEPKVVSAAGGFAEALWGLLSVPVLVAGVVRLRGWRPRNWLRAAAWTSGWVAAIGLMYLTAVLSGAWGNGTDAPDVSWGELAICSAWLALGAVMTHVLPRAGKRSDHQRWRADHMG
jgi:hypothetical protein